MGKVNGCRARGRQKLRFTNSMLSKRMEVKSVEKMIHAANGRNRWKSIVANTALHGTRRRRYEAMIVKEILIFKT